MRKGLLICCLLALSGALYANALSRFFPVTPAPVPALWWAIDTSAPLPISSLQQWFVESSPGQSAASLRPLPRDGVGIGLLAGVPNAQGDEAVRELMPPWPLNLARVWPTEFRYRQVMLPPASIESGLFLPLPAEAVSDVHAELVLVRSGPPQGPYEIDINFAGSPTQSVTAIDNGSSIIVAFDSVLNPWPLADAAQVLLELVPSADSPWVIVAAAPIIWRLSWQSPSAVLSGRMQWQRVLDSLLMHTGARTESVPSLAAKLLAQVQGEAVPKETAVSHRPAQLPAACGGNEGLLITADKFQADISTQLTRWLDVVLQGPLQPYRLVPRSYLGRLNGADVHFTRPVLGRGLWQGDHGFRACLSLTSCADVSSFLPSLQVKVGAEPSQGVLLSDIALGSQGQLTAIDSPANTAKAVVLGDSLLIDTGADPTSASGRTQTVLWLGVDGTLYLRDGDSGDPLWRWQPTIWQDHRSRLLAQPAALHPERISSHALQLWEGDLGERVVFALLAGKLLALDLSQPRKPRLLPLSTASVDSFTVLPKSLTTKGPELLLGVRAVPEPELSTSHLLRVNGLTGEILWRAENETESPQWLVPWTFISWQQSIRGYGVDSLGRIWRLQADAHDRGFSIPTISAQPSANLAEIEILAAPSLSIQSDANGRRRVALSLATRASATNGVLLSTWLDDERATPLVLSSLPQWSTSTEPPLHDIGWQRQLLPEQVLGLSPKWLDARVILTLETALPPKALCLAADIQTRLYDLPWRKGRSTELAKEIDLGSSPVQLAEPVITEEGKLHWLGQSKPEIELGLTAYRRRLRKAPMLD